MNSMPSAKYNRRQTSLERMIDNKEWFNFCRFEKIGREKARLEKFDKKICQRKN